MHSAPRATMKSLLSALLLSFFIASISHVNATSDAASTTLATPSASTPSAAEVTPEFVIQSPDSVPAKGKHIIIDGDNVEEIYQSDERTITPKLDTQEDIDDFIAQLLAEDSNSGSGGEDVPPPPPRKVLTEEEKEQLRKEKEEETRVKRADITSRHTKWEKRLKDAGEEEVEELLEKVRALRQKVVEDMRNKPEMFDLLKKMQKEGFDNVYKVETYLTKVKRDGKDDDTAANWGKVVGKISKMLDDRTIETTEYLKNWHRAIMTKEKEIFEASAKILENIADEAQADIGMDYAWLDDVTTNDWTRYHKLKDDVKHYTSIFESIFNSKHPEMKENPVHVELMQVETAMVRVAADLKEALDKVKLKGEMWLRGEIEETGTTDSIVDETATAAEPDITLHLYERKESTASKPKPTHGEL